MELVTKIKGAGVESRFPLGDVVITSDALDRVVPEDILRALRLHAQGDWGLTRPEDRKSNDEALAEGYRLFSEYEDGSSTRFWIITSGDRSVTTVLLPDDY